MSKQTVRPTHANRRFHFPFGQYHIAGSRQNHPASTTPTVSIWKIRPWNGTGAGAISIVFM